MFSLAKEALSSSQDSVKKWFDRKAVELHFQPGDQVLVLLLIPGSALTACFSGPFVVESKVSDTDCHPPTWVQEENTAVQERGDL